MMKLDTFIILSKGAAYVLAGFFSPWTAALAQWSNSGEWPPKISWVVILSVSIVSAASAWLAFCSGSWKDYEAQKAANETGKTQVTEVKPKQTSDLIPAQPKEKTNDQN